MHNGPVVDKELHEAYEQLEELTARLQTIKARMEEIYKEEEEAHTQSRGLGTVLLTTLGLI